jgi:ATP-dependent 26S proteasome regulatory subunit
MNPESHPIMLLLANEDMPVAHRIMVLRELLQNVTPETEALLQYLLGKIAQNSSESVYKDKACQLDAVLKQIQDGPMRVATFIERAKINGDLVSPALVMLDDGYQTYVTVPHEDQTRGLRLGDRVIVDGKARALLHPAPAGPRIGEEARLERKIDDRHIALATRGDERSIVLAPALLMEQIASGEVPPGSRIVYNSRQGMAVAALPDPDGLSHFKFLDRGPIPDVIVERDIGAPPKVIGATAAHIRQEMTRPEARRRYGLRRCAMKLLCGVSGSGKTLAVQAIHRLMYEIMSEVTRVPMDKLPARVFRIRSSQVLSMWLGESDKNVDRMFDEIEQLAAEPFRVPGARRFELPLLVVMEEADSLARARGDHEAVYDRILTTVLQRLDPNREGLREKLVIFLATTNVPQVVDPAFLRRAGGTIEHFGRLNRAGFKAVLRKLVRGLPAALTAGCTSEEVWARCTDDLTAWLFGPNSDRGVLELTYAGSTTPVIKRHRDFLTGALVDRAVQQAAEEACGSEQEATSGISPAQLMRAIHAQVLSVVDQIREHNAGSFIDLPDGVRVALVRRIPQPSHLPIEFQAS